MIEEIVFEFPIVSCVVEFLSLRKILWLLKLVHGSQSLLERGFEQCLALVLLGDPGMLGLVHGLVLLQALLDVLFIGDEAGSHFDLAVGRSELDSVANQVDEDLREAGLVDLH